jgi:hypothetical protein
MDNKVTSNTNPKTLVGNVFNNMHPFGIIYTLYKDVAGAASGVEVALQQESSYDSAQPESARSEYEATVQYWTERFKTRIQSLRMYGTNGNLFNAAQQAWLGTASFRDVRRLVKTKTYSDPTSTTTSKDPFSARWSTAKALGLQNLGSDFVYSQFVDSKGKTFDLATTNMFAFSQSLQEFGTVNLWQSTYETKMDMSQRVMDVTGYEFYQDVDGDLVFKPPFYNLDTSSSRYYRLEDEDIINISFIEKEPAATYIIVRGTWFTGFTDIVPNQGATGNRALFIDYKLVSKFGWRPAPTMDITYATDPKALFYIGIARMDVLNVDTFSAQATIPIRAEMRPGYPVYIPFIDSYYYIRQLSHQFAFGGLCTTSLVLVCKRSKFFAPGELKAAPPGKSAIGLIKLDRPDLPPRPLQTYDQQYVPGRGQVVDVPRIVGFPNVVMALDPLKINPNFTVVGLGLDYLLDTKAGNAKSAELLFNMIKRDIDLLNAFTYTEKATGPINPDEKLKDNTLTSKFSLRVSDTESIEFDVQSLASAIEKFRSASSVSQGLRKKIQSLTTQLENQIAIDNPISSTTLDNKVKKAGAGRNRKASIDSLRGKLVNARRNLLLEQAKADQFLENTEEGQLLAQIFKALQPNPNNPTRRKLDGVQNSGVTMSYYETLSHLKTQYSTDTLPGYYRYYSSAHPDPEMQGSPIVEFRDPNRGLRRRSGGSSGGSADVPGPPPLVRSFVLDSNGEEVLVERGYGSTLSKEGRASLISRANGCLTANGVTFTSFTRGTNQVTTKNAAGKEVKVTNEGLLTGRGKNREKKIVPVEELLTVNKANALIGIAVVAQQVIDQAKSNPEWPEGQEIVQISALRDEDPENEAQHGFGLAIDLAIASSIGRDRRGVNNPNAFKALQILAKTANAARAQSLITGLGIYVATGSGMFIHMDRRSTDSLAVISQARGGDSPGGGPGAGGAWGESGPGAQQKPPNGLGIADTTSSVYNAVVGTGPSSALINGEKVPIPKDKNPVPIKLEACVTDLSKDAFVTPDEGATDQTGSSDGQSFNPDDIRKAITQEGGPPAVDITVENQEVWGDFLRRVQQSTGGAPFPQILAALNISISDVIQKVLGNLAISGASLEATSSTDPNQDGKEDSGPKEETPPKPKSSSGSGGTRSRQELKQFGIVNVRQVQLQAPRQVIQFKTEVEKPSPEAEAPEVVLGLGSCSRGLFIAGGPGSKGRLLTTDQIQTISFVRHDGYKNTGIISVSTRPPARIFDRDAFRKIIRKKFEEAVDSANEDPEKLTIEDVFSGAYNKIRESLGSIKVTRNLGEKVLFKGSSGDVKATVQDRVSIADFVRPFNDLALIYDSVFEGPDGDGNQTFTEITVTDEGGFEFKQSEFKDVNEVVNAGISLTKSTPIAKFTISNLGSLAQTKVALEENLQAQEELTSGPPGTEVPDVSAPQMLSAQKFLVSSDAKSGDYTETFNGLIEFMTDQFEGPAGNIYEATKNAIEAAGGKDKQKRLKTLEAQFNAAAAAVSGEDPDNVTVSKDNGKEVEVQGQKRSGIHSPVFPVSDAKGYTHFGSFRYGRGLSIEPGGNFQFIQREDEGDPFRNVTQQTAELFLQALTQVQSVKSTRTGKKAQGGQSAQASTGTEAAAKEVEKGKEQGKEQTTNMETRASAGKAPQNSFSSENPSFLTTPNESEE